jgi:DNA-binding NarL/FixJ family response regulator
MISVLLADDHRMVRDGLRLLLEASTDIQITAMASNGQEAVEQALLNCPDIALIDISMPVMNGIEAAQQILANCPHTQVMMLSMYDTPNYVRSAINAGAQGYMLKDAAGNELVEAVRTLYSGDNYFSPRIAEIARQILK